MTNDQNQSKHVSAGEGWQWFVTAIRAVRFDAFRLFLITFLYMCAMAVLSLLPTVGPVFAAVFMPFGTVMLGYGTRDALMGVQPGLAGFKDGFRDPKVRNNLFMIGMVFGFILITLNMLYGMLSASDLAQWKIDEQNRVDWKSVATHFPWKAIFIVTVLYIPCLMATWFSPLLVIEKKMSWGKSLFYSFFGCLKNLLPILLLGIILITAVSGMIMITSELVGLLGLAGVELYLYVPVVFICTTTVYCTYWPMYVSLFGSTRSDDPDSQS